MKNVYEVLRQKELELSRLEKEVEALRVAAPLLSEDKEASADKPTIIRAAKAITNGVTFTPVKAVPAAPPAPSTSTFAPRSDMRFSSGPVMPATSVLKP